MVRPSFQTIVQRNEVDVLIAFAFRRVRIVSVLEAARESERVREFRLARQELGAVQQVGSRDYQADGCRPEEAGDKRQGTSLVGWRQQTPHFSCHKLRGDSCF